MYAELRKAIRDHLAAEITEVDERIFNGFTAPADTPKPYLVIEMSGEVPSTSNSRRGWARFDVLSIGNEGDYLSLDPIADAVVVALDQQSVVLETGTMRPEHKRDSRIDMWIAEVNGTAIRDQFWIPA
ncbi:MAG: hypothetical protein M0R06_17870 [Sphaerochaeta sp.]|jgi:hypothetical protein|nr:hypothetical protein [Sphaerochaeta sp.]